MRRDWPGLIAFVLACSIGISLCAAIIIVSIKPEPLDQPFAAVITTLAGAAVGAVATYLGINHQRPPTEPEPYREEPEEKRPDVL
jgi:hypothetical protein